MTPTEPQTTEEEVGETTEAEPEETDTEVEPQPAQPV